MIGAIAGDIIGSVYERSPIKSVVFPLFTNDSCFTDDTVLTCAVADAILSGEDCAFKLREYFSLFPHAGYGAFFSKWAKEGGAPRQNSWGNGAAMRISPVGLAFDSLESVLQKAREFTEITHKHPEAVKGAQAAAGAVFLARTGKTKNEIRDFVSSSFGYDLSKTCDEIRPSYHFDPSCQETVPQALTAFLESRDYESAVRLAVSLGGDSDTLACITGAAAQAFYKGVPDDIADEALKRLDPRLRRIAILFDGTFCTL